MDLSSVMKSLNTVLRGNTSWQSFKERLCDCCEIRNSDCIRFSSFCGISLLSAMSKRVTDPYLQPLESLQWMRLYTFNTLMLFFSHQIQQKYLNQCFSSILYSITVKIHGAFIYCHLNAYWLFSILVHKLASLNKTPNFLCLPWEKGYSWFLQKKHFQLTNQNPEEYRECSPVTS
jgi:hypothetical protein